MTAWVTGPVLQIAEKDTPNKHLESRKEPLKNSRSVQSPKTLAKGETKYTKLCDGNQTSGGGNSLLSNFKLSISSTFVNVKSPIVRSFN